MYIFQFTLPLTLNLIIMINTSTYPQNTTPPLPTFFFLSPKKKAKKKQGFCKRHCWHMPSISFACGGLTFERVFEPWGGVNEEELGLVLRYHLVILLDGLSEHVLRKLVLGADTNNFKVTHKQLQGHTETTSRSHRNQGHTETTLQLQWCGVVKGQDTGSGVNKVETTAGVWQQSGFTCSVATIFSTPKILTLTHR